LNIDVQFNLPLRAFSSRSGGTFLKHTRTGRMVLAHRGIVTLGRGRIKKAALFGEMAATIRHAETTSGVKQFLLIVELESPTLASEIGDFASELRRTVRTIKTGSGTRDHGTSGLRKKLSQYFDEPTGERTRKAVAASIADCHHGSVVRTLRDLFHADRNALKSQAIDLVISEAKEAFLFEVKTSADTQSIYTGVGQLLLHAPVVAAELGKRTVRVLILPTRPRKHLCNILQNDLDIRVLTFVRSPKGRITINGLKGLRWKPKDK